MRTFWPPSRFSPFQVLLSWPRARNSSLAPQQLNLIGCNVSHSYLRMYALPEWHSRTEDADIERGCPAIVACKSADHRGTIMDSPAKQRAPTVSVLSYLYYAPSFYPNHLQASSPPPSSAAGTAMKLASCFAYRLASPRTFSALLKSRRVGKLSDWMMEDRAVKPTSLQLQSRIDGCAAPARQL
jgi:hypothetical protein